MDNSAYLFDTNDSLEFGQMINEPFKWVYLLAPSYLDWMIRETHVCFINPELFYGFGKPYELLFDALPEAKHDSLIALTKELGKNHFVGNSKGYLLTIDIILKAISSKVLSISDFERQDFEFSAKALLANKEKLKGSNPHFHSFEQERNNLLSSIFRDCI